MLTWLPCGRLHLRNKIIILSLTIFGTDYGFVAVRQVFLHRMIWITVPHSCAYRREVMSVLTIHIHFAVNECIFLCLLRKHYNAVNDRSTMNYDENAIEFCRIDIYFYIFSRPTANIASNFYSIGTLLWEIITTCTRSAEDSADHLTSTRDLFSSDVKGLLKQNREVLFRYSHVQHFAE